MERIRHPNRPRKRAALPRSARRGHRCFCKPNKICTGKFDTRERQVRAVPR